jgi:hypothetical protein
MSNRPARNRFLIIAAGTAVLAVAIYALVLEFVFRSQPPVSGQEIVQAIQLFSAAHRPLPPTVTFSQLVSEGYLRTNILRDFGAAEVTVYLQADQHNPQMFKLDALLPDGTHTVLFSDGSIQGFSPDKFQPTAAPADSPATHAGDSNRLGHEPPR